MIFFFVQLSVQDLTSHFFRNIHNQVKQQVGKVVRDCVVTIPDEGGPSSLDEGSSFIANYIIYNTKYLMFLHFFFVAALKRLTEAAQVCIVFIMCAYIHTYRHTTSMLSVHYE